LSRIYKLLDGASWRAAQAAGVFTGSAVDARDGFIHFSDASQARETAGLYFHGQDDLWLLAVETDRLDAELRWEASRRGALFPHLYGSLPVAAVIEARPAPLDADGVPELGPLD
jgi:uncharacterized protein (DUF952 family)